MPIISLNLINNLDKNIYNFLIKRAEVCDFMYHYRYIFSSKISTLKKEIYSGYNQDTIMPSSFFF